MYHTFIVAKGRGMDIAPLDKMGGKTFKCNFVNEDWAISIFFYTEVGHLCAIDEKSASVYIMARR